MLQKYIEEQSRKKNKRLCNALNTHSNSAPEGILIGLKKQTGSNVQTLITQRTLGRFATQPDSQQSINLLEPSNGMNRRARADTELTS